MIEALAIAGILLAPPAATKPARPAAARAQAPTFEQLTEKLAAARAAGRTDEAINLARQALSLQPAWAEGWWTLGTTLYDLDRHEEARDAFRRLSTIDGKKGAVWALIGLCDFQLKNYERALINIHRGNNLGLGASQELLDTVTYHIAILSTRFEQFEVAIETLLPLARRGNETTPIAEALGLAMLRMPFLPSEAPPERREMILMAGRAALFGAARRSEAAVRLFEELVTRYPETANVHYAFGTFLLRESSDRALEEFERELKLSPNHVAALLQIAFERLTRGEHAAALPYAQKAVDLEPTYPIGRLALGRCLFEAGEISKAVEQLEIGVKTLPESAQMHFYLGRAYAKAGRADDAAREQAEFERLEKERADRTPVIVGVPKTPTAASPQPER
jgi:tetratricopeptide (TPR) repeat protein